MQSLLDHITTLRLVIDFGLVVLIWMVQLIVYPGFLFYQEKDLITWHKVYTPRITIIVAPLMFIQAAVALYLVIIEFSLLHLIYTLLVVSIWISTFLFFVPLHQNIESQKHIEVSAEKLSRGNLYRAFQWTVVFIFGLSFLSS
ncbi:hypothetical protein [Psychroflexus tropicus]|uniref:hypothetical protein n=1 Tax=Psychroflexus tropicus TaxID=197345 RepID=UPI0003A3D700|nr:hypothetical protein [Psychroflexus tropicus]